MGQRRHTLEDGTLENLAGLKNGDIEVIRYAGHFRNCEHRWWCRCICGKEFMLRHEWAKKPRSVVCRCAQRDGIPDQIGNRFGKLIVLEYAGKSGKYHRWLCQCDCGKQTTARDSTLKNGTTRSCGCSMRNTIHGWSMKNGKRPSEYGSWQGIVSRCTSKKDKAFGHYGGRGIKVCDRWRYGDDKKSGFECFLEDVGPKPPGKYSIDRMDVNGDYRPGNVRWATQREQIHNRRNTVSILKDGKLRGYYDAQSEFKVISDVEASIGRACTMQERFDIIDHAVKKLLQLHSDYVYDGPLCDSDRTER